MKLKMDADFIILNNERFPLFVPRRYYVPARTFLGVRDQIKPEKRRNCHETFRNGQERWND
jgi:hypothetical protein